MSEARDALLGRVVAHYAEHGVHDTSLRTLAAAIGTSQRMLHYHFGSREDVLTAVIDAIASQQAAQIAQLFADTADPFAAGRRNWEATVEGAMTFGPLWFELATYAMHGAPYAERLKEVMVRAQVRELTAIYAGYTQEGQARRLARLTVAVGQGLIFSLLLDGDRPAADEAVEEFADLIAAALLPPGFHGSDGNSRASA